MTWSITDIVNALIAVIMFLLGFILSAAGWMAKKYLAEFNEWKTIVNIKLGIDKDRRILDQHVHDDRRGRALHNLQEERKREWTR